MDFKITQQSLTIFVLFLLLFMTSSAFSGIRYNVIDLGGLPGYEMSRAWSINDNGQVVGEALNFTSGFNTCAVLFDTSGTGNNIDLGTLGGTGSAAMSINNSGQIMGFAESAQDYFATIFDSAGGGNNTGLVAGSTAWSSNDSNQIVGFVELDPGTIHHAALFDQSRQGSYTDLGSLANYDSSEAISINNAGAIVGYAGNLSEFALFHYRAVLFDTADPNHNVDMGTLPGYEYATAFYINDNRQVVGRAHSGDMGGPFATYNPHAVLFNINDPNNNIDLGTLPEYDSAEACTINNRGQIVGRAIKDFSITAAVLFDPTGGGNNINLNDLVNPASGWKLELAWCMNDKGWIAGWGVCPDRYHHAFLLVPIPAGPADFDLNSKVDFYDFGAFALAWATTVADGNYNPDCDLDFNGQVNHHDLSIFVKSWSPDL